jgi:riboflavin synthase
MTLTELDLDHLAIGASVAVDGVCLTAVELDAATVSVDIVPETLSRTTLGLLDRGDLVNIEFAMRADGRFDGHIVQGHVDGTGTIDAIEQGSDGSTTFEVSANSELMRYLVEKGSITMSGVSLTVVDVTPQGFSVALIPHTLQVTTLGAKRVGDPVNLEVDVLAKYVERLTRS